MRPRLGENDRNLLSGGTTRLVSSGRRVRWSRAGGRDRGLPGLPACRPPELAWSVLPTDRGCQGKNGVAPISRGWAPGGPRCSRAPTACFRAPWADFLITRREPVPSGRQRVPRDRRTVGRGGPEAQVRQDLFNHLGSRLAQIVQTINGNHAFQSSGTTSWRQCRHVARPGSRQARVLPAECLVGWRSRRWLRPRRWAERCVADGAFWHPSPEGESAPGERIQSRLRRVVSSGPRPCSAPGSAWSACPRRPFQPGPPPARSRCSSSWSRR